MMITRVLGVLLCLGLLTTSAAAVAQGLPIPKKDAPPTDQKDQEKQKGWLGIGLKEIPADEAKARGYDHPLVRVDSIFGGSPAEASGFAPEDVILEVDGARIKSSKQLVSTIGGHAAGDKVKIKLLRGKEIIDVPLLLGIHPGRYGLLRSRFVDKPAPAFTIKNAKDNKDLTLASLKGKVVVVDFWATWCGPCRKAIPQLNELQAELGQKGVQVVGISDEERKTVQSFLQKTEVSYTMGCDESRASNRDYLVSALPTLFVIDHEGVVRDVHIGAGKFDELRALVDKLVQERDAKK